MIIYSYHSHTNFLGTFHAITHKHNNKHMMGSQANARESMRQSMFKPSKTAGLNKYNPTKPSNSVKSYTPMEWKFLKTKESTK